MNDDPNASTTHMPGSPNSWRLLSDLLNIWALCGRSGCRRAKACRGDSRQCIPDCGYLVPEDVREWAVEMFECKRRGLPFDDARASLDPELEEAWADWDSAVRRIADRQKGRACLDALPGSDKPAAGAARSR
jgi:hypothetical protein